MTRPCYLVVDREYASSISTRKLVIETAKLNVITSYSSAEAIATLQRFPNVDGVVMDCSLPDMAADDLAQALKAIQPKIVIVAIAGPGRGHCAHAEYHLDTFDPARLLEVLKGLTPAATAAIEAQNESLNQQDR